MKPCLYIVVPCYNEESVLPLTVGLFTDKINSLTIDGTISEDSKFTQMMLIEAIGSMLEKATLPTEDSLLTDSDF